MLFAIGGEIVAFVGGHAGSEAASVAGILAASTDGAITGAEALGLLVGASIWGGAALQVAAGGGIAGLVAAGSVTSNTAAIGVYNAFLDSGLALDAIWSRSRRACGRTVASASAPRCSTRSPRMAFATYADLAGQPATAVDAGTLSVGEMIDGSVAARSPGGQHRSRRGLRCRR